MRIFLDFYVHSRVRDFLELYKSSESIITITTNYSLRNRQSAILIINNNKTKKCLNFHVLILKILSVKNKKINK